MYNNNVFEINGTPVQKNGWIDAVSTDLAVQYLQSRATATDGKSFSLTIGYKSPHHPYTPPAHLTSALSSAVANPAVNANALPPYPTTSTAISNEDMRNYFRTVMGVDEQVGRVMTSLSNLGLDQNTVVIFSSDNGYFRGEHGQYDKRLAYEESIRVPMLVRYPTMISGNSTLSQMVLNVDVAPTILDLAGVAIPASMQGRSIKPLLSGQTSGWRSDFLYQYFEDDGYPPPYAPQENYAVRTATAKLVKWPGHPEWTQLFNLSSDPYEMNNLYGKSSAASLQKDMLARFDAAAARVGFVPSTTATTSSLLKLNFQPADRPAVPGYTIDSGKTFAARNGHTYGWSVSHTSNVFDRNNNSNQLLDTGVAVKAGAKWEMAVPNGRYTVKVGIGDIGQSSYNTVYVEGKPLFVSQALRASQFNILPVTVDVFDGRITLSFSGSQTRLTYLTVTTVGQTPPPPPPPTTSGLRFNFQPANAPGVSGYLVDAGQPFASRNGQTYGWTINHADAVFDRNVNSTQLLDTVVSVKQGAKWELALPGGRYIVTVGVGDAAATSKNNIWVEGKQLFNYQSQVANVFSSKAIEVDVNDGRLTIGIGSAASGLTRVNFVDIVPLTSTKSSAKINFQPSAAPSVGGYLVDAGQTYGNRNGQAYGWTVAHTDAVFDRNSNTNQLLDTHVAVKAGSRWELAVPNGSYLVTVSVGDSAASTKNNVWVENNWVFQYLNLAANTFSTKSIRVNVADGKLTVGIGSAATGLTRINFVDLAA